MKYFLDCEFIDNGATIDLISIGIVCQDGREYYAINANCQFQLASNWVWENVLKPIEILPVYKHSKAKNPITIQVNTKTQESFRNKDLIKEELKLFFNKAETQDIEIWGEWCSYDWVAFCQIFGTMCDLPKNLPMYCLDIIQYAHQLNIMPEELPPSLETERNHHALLGAKTVQQRYKYLEKIDKFCGSLLRNPD